MVFPHFPGWSNRDLEKIWDLGCGRGGRGNVRSMGMLGVGPGQREWLGGPRTARGTGLGMGNTWGFGSWCIPGSSMGNGEDAALVRLAMFCSLWSFSGHSDDSVVTLATPWSLWSFHGHSGHVLVTLATPWSFQPFLGHSMVTHSRFTFPHIPAWISQQYQL